MIGAIAGDIIGSVYEGNEVKSTGVGVFPPILLECSGIFLTV